MVSPICWATRYQWLNCLFDRIWLQISLGNIGMIVKHGDRGMSAWIAFDRINLPIIFSLHKIK